MHPDANARSEPPIDHLPTHAGYERWAAIYDSEDNPLVALEEPHIQRLLGEVEGLHIADVGCGTGRHALPLAARGAHVTALDFAGEMLRRARAKPAAERVRFVEHDLARPLPLPDAAFDRVLCALVIDHIPDLAALFGEFGRICRADGRILLSMMHPAMMLRGISARFTDPVTGRETRPASEPHQISDYVTALLQAGLRIAEMSEHAVDEALAARSPRAAKYAGWPLLLLFDARP